MSPRRSINWDMNATHASMAQYLNRLAKSGKNTAKTISCKRNTLARFAAQAPADPRRIRLHHVQAFVDAIDTPGGKKSDLSRLRGWVHWAVRQGHLHSDPTEEVMLPLARGTANFRSRALREDQARSVVQAAAVKPRRLLMTLMMLQEGARGSEVARSSIEDWDTRSGMLRLYGKGSKWREVLASAETLDAFGAYLDARGGNRVRGPLFTDERSNFPSKGIGWQTVHREVMAALRDAGIKVPKEPGVRVLDGISPHALRHTAFTARADAGCPTDVIQEIAGHDNPQTTKIYTRGARYKQEEWVNLVRYSDSGS